MADTVLYTVWTTLADTLAAISPTAGYRTTVRTVTTDPTQLEALPSPLTPALVVLLDEEQSRTVAEGMPGEDGAAFVFRVLGRVDCGGLDTAARVAAYADVRDDIRRAVASDITCGGVAWDCRITWGVGPDMDQGRILFRFDVTVNVTLDEAES